MRMLQHCNLTCYGLEAPLWSSNELFFLPQQHRKSEHKSSVCSRWIPLGALSLGCCHNEELSCELHVAVLLHVHSNACTHGSKVAAGKKTHTLTRTRRAPSWIHRLKLVIRAKAGSLSWISTYAVCKVDKADSSCVVTLQPCCFMTFFFCSLRAHQTSARAVVVSSGNNFWDTVTFMKVCMSWQCIL